MNSSNKNLNLLIWNSQSLIPKKDETFNFLKNNNVHVALISETWLKARSVIGHPDFNCYRRDRPNDGHGGVAILISKKI